MNTDIADDRELQFLVANRRNAILRCCRINNIRWKEGDLGMGYLITEDLEVRKLVAHANAEFARGQAA